jgi:hypothetical protein
MFYRNLTNKILALVFFISLASGAISQDKTLADFGIEVSFSADQTIFPKSWLTNEINGKATPLDSAEFERSKKVIIKALNKYPAELIKKHLSKVYVVSSLEFYGQSYGGTNSTSDIYLTNRGKDWGYSDFWIEQAFHSEFSSILFRNYSFLFDKKKWVSYNKDIQYGESGTQALKEGKASTEFDFELNKRGILAQYGTASIEEDFNMFAHNIFLSTTGFWEIGKMHKRIFKKTNQVIEFYNRIDSRFNLAYFQAISSK